MEKAFVGNAADEDQVKSAKKKELSKRERELDDIRFVLSSDKGQSFLWRYLEACGVYQTSFADNSNLMSFKEGQRSVGLKLLSDIIEADSNKFLQMMKNNKEG